MSLSRLLENDLQEAIKIRFPDIRASYTPYVVTELIHNGKTYLPQKLLGIGANGKSQLFTHDLDNIVIKIPLHSSKNISWYNLQTGKKFLEITYPENKPYTLYSQEHNNSFFSAFAMPYFPGKHFNVAVSFATSEIEILHILLATIVELQRIHHLGVIHGDINSNNILVDIEPVTKKIIVHFIDFEYAYSLEGAATTTPDDCIYWAPERVKIALKNISIKPHTNQDVYSVGYLLKNQVLLEYPETQKILHDFYQSTLGVRRPCLDDLLKKIRERLLQLNLKVAMKESNLYKNIHAHFFKMPENTNKMIYMENIDDHGCGQMHGK